MTTKKYPIGTRIRFTPSSLISCTEAIADINKTGIIAGFSGNKPIIFLPQSKHISVYSVPWMRASWQTSWKNIEILSQKNQQLLFAFMDK